MIYKNLLCRICYISLIALFATNTFFAQGRERVVQPQVTIEPEDIQPTNEQDSSQISKGKPFPYSPSVQKRKTLEQPIVIVGQTQSAAVKPVNAVNPKPQNYSSGNQSLNSVNQKLLQAIQSKIGIPYVYGSQGPGSYDCSGLVWSVFQSAGVSFERTSAGNFWRKFEPVSDNEKYKFGTLVFFNGLGHVGIVADENGFYHASSSKGVTYSPFAGYWEKRIVGFRRIPINAN
jgi:cell wall-associated NlpC family hydrolase